jgi:hypothetical protein
LAALRGGDAQCFEAVYVLPDGRIEVVVPAWTFNSTAIPLPVRDKVVRLQRRARVRGYRAAVGRALVTIGDDR